MATDLPKRQRWAVVVEAADNFALQLGSLSRQKGINPCLPNWKALSACLIHKCEGHGILVLVSRPAL